MNLNYQEALRKGLEIAYAANGESFMRAYREMTQDLCQKQRQKKHREKQRITIKGIFKEV